ncbi:LysM domain-containing protein [Paenibacillus sp. UNCCL117]|uniref:LysM peptidoglycan-binding domain-containing protein n=1 Tax=unclassified Paenibacillus TaxID=185978 RepID=UPI000880F046|nr:MULTISPECIES: LysM peptidoglycan-binding domain-containing protein [unclassified Paenibacillus]SDD75524.1 LysM domain-containing protein [Paenibacillus sp. cl123]SFW52195.1 LysM domain-containing protein [Paenibacillus sp. UNCCL117]
MNVPYGIYVGWNNAESWFRLPVNPETLEVKQSGAGRSYDMIGLGEINAIQAPRLREISFSSVLPSRAYPYVSVASADLQPASWYVERLTEWMHTKRPVRLVVTGSHTELADGRLAGIQLNLPVSIERFDWKEAARGGGDIEYELALKAYMFYAAKKVHIVTDAQSGEPVAEEAVSTRANERIPPSSYTLKEGDNLWAIAALLLGDGSRYREIQQLNGISDAELRRLPAGRELRLPEVGV